MSTKGNCCDNAAMESWDHSRKTEAFRGETFATRTQARAQVCGYFDGPAGRGTRPLRQGALAVQLATCAVVLRWVFESESGGADLHLETARPDPGLQGVQFACSFFAPANVDEEVY